MTALASSNKQQMVYNEILRVYDLAEGIIDAIEEDADETSPNKMRLSQPVIDQIVDSIDVVAQQYIKFIDNKEHASKKDIEVTEGAFRKIYVRVGNFFQGLRAVESSQKPRMKVEVEDIQPSEVLPRVGKEPGDLILGKMWDEFEEEISRLPNYERFIRRVRSCLIHIWRIIYRFARMKNGLVRNPQAILWGRTAADAKAQALLGNKKDRDLNFSH